MQLDMKEKELGPDDTDILEIALTTILALDYLKKLMLRWSIILDTLASAIHWQEQFFQLQVHMLGLKGEDGLLAESRDSLKLARPAYETTVALHQKLRCEIAKLKRNVKCTVDLFETVMELSDVQVPSSLLDQQDAIEEQAGSLLREMIVLVTLLATQKECA